MESRFVKRTGWEYFVIVCVVGCSLLLSAALYAKRDHLCKSRQMILELLTLRNIVTAHILEHHKRPESLEVIEGPKVDPFGNRYQYDAERGWVYSLSAGL